MMANFNTIFTGRTFSRVLLILFLVLYIVLPSGFSTTDSWNYAASIRHSGEFFQPYHLLYNSLGYLFCYIPASAGADTLGCLKIMNALFAVLTILTVQTILRSLGKSERIVVSVSCIAGFSFSLMRFATENETYIVPLSLALWATYFYIGFVRSGNVKNALYAGTLTSAAILFHVTYIFWWTALLTGFIAAKKLKPLMSYLTVSLIVPLVYLITIFYVSGNLAPDTVTGFVFGDLNRNAHFGISATGLFLSVVNLIRSFIQIHGYIYNMIRTDFLFVIPGIVSLVFFALSLFVLPSGRQNFSGYRISGVLILIIVLQFLFSMVSAGNAEFMVMIPVLSFILIPVLFSNCEKFLLRVMAGMMIWNLFYGLIPLNIDTSGPEQYLCEKTVHVKNALVIAADDQLLQSMVYYKTGKIKTGNIFKSPAVMEIGGLNQNDLETLVDSALIAGVDIYTDCTGRKTISRASILEGSTNREFFTKYETLPVKTWTYVTGEKSVSRITGKR
jgi:hypothetical protein